MGEFTAVFTGGTGRSGTTVLAKMLRCHRQIRASRPLEVRCVTDAAGVCDLCVGVRADGPWRLRVLAHAPWLLEREFQRRFRGHWWMRENRLGKTSGLHRGMTQAQREQILANFAATLRIDRMRAGRELVADIAHAQGLQSERYWIDTSPPNIANADRIHALIPDARFVHMVRDGKDTMASVLQEKWGPTDAESAARWWAERMAAAHRALSEVPEHLVMTVSLESLVVTDRQEQYQRVLDFFELSDRDRMHRYFAEQMPAERVRPGSWAQRVADPEGLERAYQKAAERLVAAGIPTHEFPRPPNAFPPESG